LRRHKWVHFAIINKQKKTKNHLYIFTNFFDEWFLLIFLHFGFKNQNLETMIAKNETAIDRLTRDKVSLQCELDDYKNKYSSIDLDSHQVRINYSIADSSIKSLPGGAFFSPFNFHRWWRSCVINIVKS
jgi:hypothetical protein